MNTTRGELTPVMIENLTQDFDYYTAVIADSELTPAQEELLYEIRDRISVNLYKLEEGEFTDEEFYDLYTRYVHDKVVMWIPGRGLFISTDELPHDIFRNREYSEDCLFSLEETRQWMSEHECECHDQTDAQLAAFWKNYPDGMIAFG